MAWAVLALLYLTPVGAAILTEGTPDSVCRRLQATLGMNGIRCVSVPLEELFVELVGNNRLAEAS